MSEKDYDARYGVTSNDAAIQELHQGRRMFAIRKKFLHVSSQDSIDSHAVWFERKGWITPVDTQAMDEITRGFTDNTGVYFYRGFDFRVDETAERVFFHHFPGLVKMLELNTSLPVYGGMIRQDQPGRWPPRKEYGTIESLLVSRRA